MRTRCSAIIRIPSSISWADHRPICSTSDFPSSLAETDLQRSKGNPRQAARDPTGLTDFSGNVFYLITERDWCKLEIREIAATIMLESNCMVATSFSSKALGDEDSTSKTPSVRR